MHLTEQHIIKRDDPRFSVLDNACFLSKNLYNAGLYEMRQHFFATDKSYSYSELDKLMQSNPDYRALPSKVSQQILSQVCEAWSNHWASRRKFKQDVTGYKGKPRLPHYKDKTNGRNQLIYTDQAISKRALAKKGEIVPSKLGISVKTDKTEIDQVRIIPKKTHYVVEIVYSIEMQIASPDPNRIASIDLGVDNLATVTTNQPNVNPLLVNGRPLKSINQFYNKRMADLRSRLPKGHYYSAQMGRLTDKRNNCIKTRMHKDSLRIVQFLEQHKIGILVIGKNDGWKQEVELGKVNNQHFVQIPHAQFVAMLTYKAQMRGIEVIFVNESYTSKCSFLDDEPVKKHKEYKGRRIHRGLFQASDGKLIQADVNGALNIMKKALPNAFANGIEALVVMPERVTLAEPRGKKQYKRRQMSGVYINVHKT
ncbi:MAG: transposase [bacterium]|nr:transposase [bacterium]